MCQKEVLEVFSGNGQTEYSSRQLSEILNIRKNSISRSCSQLVKYGYLEMVEQLDKKPKVYYKLKTNSL